MYRERRFFVAVKLFDYQLDALRKMKNGCILCGGVGSGKSLTAIAYFYIQNGGRMSSLKGGDYTPMKEPPKDLYIITTARKRDTLEWEQELIPFLMSVNPEVSYYKEQKIIVDSWNNIKKYVDVKQAFFIFDEQRVAGKGVWVKSFLKITKNNKWVLLSATPGDTWQDYIPVFIANGHYRNRTEFSREHIIWNHYTSYPTINRYVNTGKLVRLRNDILIKMNYKKETILHHEDVFVDYDRVMYRTVSRTRWNPYKDEPIQNAGGLCYIWRRVVNSDESRQLAVLEIFEDHPKIVIFYNFDYELEILRNLVYGQNVKVAEWNGHKHEPIPKSDSWVYLVQYTAGAEGWNCVETDTIIFYSQNYSYKTMVQAAGRIDRLNTPFTKLYYYHLKTRSGIDLAINRALKAKKNFNESTYVKHVTK